MKNYIHRVNEPLLINQTTTTPVSFYLCIVRTKIYLLFAQQPNENGTRLLLLFSCSLNSNFLIQKTHSLSVVC